MSHNEPTVNFLIVVPLLCGGLFLGLLLFMEIGRRIGVRQHSADPEGARAGVGAVFTLLALIVAFTFSGATSRFDDRRHLVVEEANHIGTAWLRIDLLPAHAQPTVRDLFRQYLDSRLATYRKMPDMDAARVELARSVKLHVVSFAVVISAAVYVILDIEYPRLGLIRVDAIDQVLVELRQSME